MKVLIIGPFPNPIDGCAFSNQVILKNFKANKIRCDFVNTNTKTISSQQGSNFSIKKALKFIKNYINVYKIILFNRIYITPGHTFYGLIKYAPFILFCIILKKKYILHLHGNHVGKEFKSLRGLKRKFFRYLVSNASAGIVLSKSLVNNFDNLIPKEKIFIIHNFVDNSIYKYPTGNKKTDKLRIIFLSNLLKDKGILELLDALIIIKNKGIDFFVTIAGARETGSFDLISGKFHQLGKSLSYIGVVTGEEKLKKLAEANIFILPTYYKMEGQPISILEGLASGNIIITTNHAGIPDIVNEENGYLIEPRSSLAIVKCLEKIDENIEANVQKFSGINVKYAEENFTEDIFTTKVLSVLKSLD